MRAIRIHNSKSVQETSIQSIERCCFNLRHHFVPAILLRSRFVSATPHNLYRRKKQSDVMEKEHEIQSIIIVDWRHTLKKFVHSSRVLFSMDGNLLNIFFKIIWISFVGSNDWIENSLQSIQFISGNSNSYRRFQIEVVWYFRTCFWSFANKKMCQYTWNGKFWSIYNLFWFWNVTF